MQMWDGGARGPARPPWASTWQWWPARREWAAAQRHPQPPWGLTPPTRRHPRSPPPAPRPPLPAAPCLPAPSPELGTQPHFTSGPRRSPPTSSTSCPLRSRPQQPLLRTEHPLTDLSLTLRGWAAPVPPTQLPCLHPDPLLAQPPRGTIQPQLCLESQPLTGTASAHQGSHPPLPQPTSAGHPPPQSPLVRPTICSLRSAMSPQPS